MRNLILQKVLVTLCLLYCTQTFSQQDSFYNIIQEVSGTSELQDEKLISILKRIQRLQDIRFKDSVEITLNKIDLAQLNQNENARVKFLSTLILSRNNLFNHDYAEGIKNAQRALKHKSEGDSEELMYLFSTLGTINYFKSVYAKALEWHLEALKICESELDNSCLAEIYNNIAVTYFGTRNGEKIEEYTLKAYKIADSTQNLMEKSRAAGNLAIVFAEKGEFDKSEKWFLEDLKVDFDLKDSLSVSKNYNNLGRLFEYKEDFKSSLKYYTMGLEMAEKIKDEASVALGYQNVGWLLHKNGDNKEAEELFRVGMQKTSALGNLDKLRDAYYNISEFYEYTSRPELALEYFKKFNSLNDSIVGNSHLEAISKLEVQYETQKKENELLKLSKEKQENELLITRQGRRVRQLSFGLGGLALLGVLGFFLFKQRLQNKKQQELLLAISETQTEERKRIAQDLHDSIGGSLALTKAKFETAKTKLDKGSNELESALETLDKTTQQVRQISHNLMPGELVRFGLVAAINTLLENVNEEEINAQFHTNQEEERLEPLKEIQLYRIVQEALQNILKHAQAKNLFIHLNKHKDQLSLMIEDDGKGMPESAGEGMGLKNIKQRVQLLKGIFTVDSSPERGTVLNVQIPV